VVRDHVGAEKFAETLDQTFLKDIGEEELERLEAETRARKGLSEENERILQDLVEEHVEKTLQENAAPLGGSPADLSAAEGRAIDVLMAEYSGGGVVETPTTTDLTATEASLVDDLVADFAPHTATSPESGEAERKRLQAALRRVAREIEELEPEEEGSEKHKRLKARYRALQKKLRALPGGDADLEKDFSEQEDRGSEAQDRPGGGFFGAEEFIGVARGDDGSLPEHMREDAELQDALRRQAHADNFGVDDNSVASDAEMWDAVSRSWGLQEEK
jgi:predicted ribosome quality control (RQC) complex YloA/Tae2 family protein